MFAHVTVADGRNLDLSDVVDEYVQLFLPQFYDLQVNTRKHIAFLGENTLHYTIAAYLMIRFPDVSEEIMEAMKIAITNCEIARLIGAQLRVMDYATGLAEVEMIEKLVYNIIGLTCIHFGTQVVNSFLSPILDEICAIPLRKLPRKLQMELGLRAKPNHGAAYQLHQMLENKKGTQVIEYKSTAVDPRVQGDWSARVVFQLASGAPYFEHTRIAASKKTAREIASRDILDYYENNPSDYQMHLIVPEFQISNQPTVLQIEISNLVDSQKTTSTKMSMSMMEDMDLEQLLLGKFSDMKTED
ncbi:hypothetical protein DFQ28_004935 [Apophysomyces sp. BC1034]|nr:hypothetical protein DFQ29_004117 [Apophysomyces sp. BC1021]KAG0188386.1 hypothetical protein DFQ28_004935 [Apophysomyces sp. BC1034]